MNEDIMNKSNIYVSTLAYSEFLAPNNLEQHQDRVTTPKMQPQLMKEGHSFIHGHTQENC